MDMTLIKYRTKDTPYNQHAVVPICWVSDLIDWLALSDAELISRTDNVDSDAILPIEWFNYRTCNDYIKTLELVEVR